MPIAGTNGFLVWFQTWGQVTYFFVNLAYLVAVGTAAVLAAVQAKRYVDHAVGVGEPAKSGASSATPAASAVSVEEFVD